MKPKKYQEKNPEKNQEKQQELFGTDSKILWQGIFFVGILGMLGVSIHMVKHYFDLHYSTGLSGSLCNINSFFNCDITTRSNLSNVAGVPIGVFSIILALFFFFSYLFANKALKSTAYYLATINLLACLGLFAYSLIFLSGLCPMCLAYYLCSAIVFLAIYKNSKAVSFHFLSFALFGLANVAIAIPLYFQAQERDKDTEAFAQAVFKQYSSLKKLDFPPASPYHIARANSEFKMAPIRVSIFSDFQCPACKALADQVHGLKSRYKGKINIAYYFYPLDPSCNDAVKTNIHPLACKGAYLSACLKDDFNRVHDDIFEAQAKLSDKWLENYARKKNVLECYKSEKTRAEVKSFINSYSTFKISSTPTIFLNEAKIEGAQGPKVFNGIIDKLLELK